MLTQFKCIHNLHYNPKKLACMGLVLQDCCPRGACGGEASTDLMHIFWACSYLFTFWSELLTLLETKLIAVLGSACFCKCQKALLYCKTSSTVQQVCNLVNSQIQDNLHRRDCPKKFMKIWQPWLDMAASHQDALSI